MIPTTPIFKTLLEHPKRDEVCSNSALRFIWLFDHQVMLKDMMLKAPFKCQRTRLLLEVCLMLLEEIDFSQEVNQEALERVTHKLLESGHFKP